MRSHACYLNSVAQKMFYFFLKDSRQVYQQMVFKAYTINQNDIYQPYIEKNQNIRLRMLNQIFFFTQFVLYTVSEFFLILFFLTNSLKTEIKKQLTG